MQFLFNVILLLPSFLLLHDEFLVFQLLLTQLFWQLLLAITFKVTTILAHALFVLAFQLLKLQLILFQFKFIVISHSLLLLFFSLVLPKSIFQFLFISQSIYHPLFHFLRVYFFSEQLLFQIIALILLNAIIIEMHELR